MFKSRLDRTKDFKITVPDHILIFPGVSFGVRLASTGVSPRLGRHLVMMVSKLVKLARVVVGKPAPEALSICKERHP
jgi:hypothetical protein